MLRLVARSAASVRARAAAPAPLALRFSPPLAPPLCARALSAGGAGRAEALPDGLVVGGVPLAELARRPRRELQEALGEEKARRARQALPQRWNSLVGAGKVSAPVVRQVFQAATRLQLPKLMLEAFDYWDEHYPERVDFVMYGEVFNLLSRTGQAEAVRRIYERVKDRFGPERPAPEIIYRFGVYALLGQEDVAGVEQLLRDMVRAGVPVSNEIASRVMAGLAKAGSEQAVLDVARSLDPAVGRWHPADVNRVVTALGLVGRADEAFAFYRESQVQLSGNTLLALLRVCELNDRPRHAQAVLRNRARFRLALDTRQFNRVLESLELFGMRGEIAAVLDEMVDARVPLDADTHAIIARNQDVLQGSAFAVSAAADGWEKRSRQMDEPLVKDLLARRAFADVAAIADAYARPVTAEEVAQAGADAGADAAPRATGATTLPAWLAAPAVAAYSATGDRHKLAGLLRGLALVKSDGSVERALALAAKLAAPAGGARDTALQYLAFRALQFQGLDIRRARDAIECFRGQRDLDAAVRLCQQTSRQFADALARADGDARAASRAVGFDRVYILNAALQLLVEAHELSAVVDVLNDVERLGLPVTARDYAAVFGAMRTHNQRQSLRDGRNGGNGNGELAYDAHDFEMVWRDMTLRGVAPTTRVLSQVCSAVRGGAGTSMQRSVLSAYQQLQRASPAEEREEEEEEDDDSPAAGDRDAYVMPLPCYTALLEMAARHAGVEDVRALYRDAVAHMDESAAAMRAKSGLRRSAQREWATICVAKLAADGDADEALALLLGMPAECHAPPSYGGIMAVLQALAARDAGGAKAAELLALLREQHQQQRFALRLKDVEAVASAAIAGKDARLAHGVLELLTADVTRGKAVGGRSQGRSQNVERRLLELYGQLLASMDRSEAGADLVEGIDACVVALTARVQQQQQGGQGQERE